MNTPQEFAALLEGLHRFQAETPPAPAALVTLIRTRGAVFRRPGARMLVSADGRTVRGLSAGCPEADIIERARDVLRRGLAHCQRYDREHGFDVLIETGCGGELEVLIEPLPVTDIPFFMAAAADGMRQRTNGMMATAFERNGQCLQKPLRWLQAGSRKIDEFSAASIPAPEMNHFAGPWLPRVESCATQGGTVSIFVEPLLPPPRLILIGVNATSLALSRAGRTLGWEVLRLTHRDDESVSEFSPQIAPPAQLTEKIKFDARTAVVMATHHFERDLAYLHALEGQPLAYLGAIGSRSRSAKIRAAVPALNEILHAPAGLDIGSETPEEIAIAVIAEIQAVFAGRKGGSLIASDAPIHGHCA